MWKYTGQLLDMTKTLDENGVSEDVQAMDEVGMREDLWMPTLHLYFSDDLTVE
jgi:hypothetical protein